MLVLLVLCTQLFGSVMPCGPGRGMGGGRRLRRLRPLVFHQQVPNFSENNPMAAGVAGDKVMREDVRFKGLEVNYNEDIVFRDDEGTGADRVMTLVIITGYIPVLHVQL